LVSTPPGCCLRHCVRPEFTLSGSPLTCCLVHQVNPSVVLECPLIAFSLLSAFPEDGVTYCGRALRGFFRYPSDLAFVLPDSSAHACHIFPPLLLRVLTKGRTQCDPGWALPPTTSIPLVCLCSRESDPLGVNTGARRSKKHFPPPL